MFYLQKPIVAAKDVTIEGTVAMVRQANNPRLYNVQVSQSLSRGDCIACRALSLCFSSSSGRCDGAPPLHMDS